MCVLRVSRCAVYGSSDSAGARALPHAAAWVHGGRLLGRSGLCLRSCATSSRNARLYRCAGGQWGHCWVSRLRCHCPLGQARVPLRVVQDPQVYRKPKRRPPPYPPTCPALLLFGLHLPLLRARTGAIVHQCARPLACYRQASCVVPSWAPPACAGGMVVLRVAPWCCLPQAFVALCGGCHLSGRAFVRSA